MRPEGRKTTVLVFRKEYLPELFLSFTLTNAIPDLLSSASKKHSMKKKKSTTTYCLGLCFSNI